MLARKTLKETTWELYHNRPRQTTVQKILDDTGLTRGWLADFANNRQKHISVDKVQILYEYLSGRSLGY